MTHAGCEVERIQIGRRHRDTVSGFFHVTKVQEEQFYESGKDMLLLTNIKDGKE